MRHRNKFCDPELPITAFIIDKRGTCISLQDTSVHVSSDGVVQLGTLGVLIGVEGFVIEDAGEKGVRISVDYKDKDEKPRRWEIGTTNDVSSALLWIEQVNRRYPLRLQTV